MPKYFGRFILDEQKLQLHFDGKLLPLEPRGFALLVFLIENRDRVVSKDEIFEKVWDGRIVSDSSLTTAVRNIRRTLSDTGDDADYIQTLYGRGLRFVGEVREASTISADQSVKETRGMRSNLARIGVLTVCVCIAIGVLFFRDTTTGPKITDQTAATLISPNTQDTSQPSIAVLPFVDLTANADHKFLGDGMAEEMINGLANLDALKVISRTSAFAMSNDPRPLQDIARELGVPYIVEGSVRSNGDTVRITAQLIETASDSHLWSKTYDQPFSQGNSIEIQQIITDQIVAEVAAKLSLTAPDPPAHSISAEAYRKYVTGLDLMRKLEPGPLIEAIDLFKDTIATHPDYAPAYAGLVEASTSAITHAGLPWWDTVDGLRPAILEGIRRAPEAPEMLYAAGLFAQHDLRPDEAISYYDEALSSKPNYAQAHRGRGHTLFLVGQFEEALEAYQTALTFDPVSADLLSSAATMHLQLGDVAGALEVAQRNIRWNPTEPVALHQLAQINRQRAEYSEAHEQLHEGAKLNRDFYFLQQELALLYVDLGMAEKAFDAATHSATVGQVTALTGNIEEARRLAKLDPDEYAYAALIAEENDLAYYIFREEATQVDFAGDTRFGMRQAFFFAEIAHILSTKDDPDADKILAKLEQLLTDHPAQSLELLDALLGGAAVHTMQGRHDEALDWLEEAVRRGHAFHRIRHHPVFKALKDLPRFQSLYAEMATNATKHRETAEIYLKIR